jgi:hypothetical protein
VTADQSDRRVARIFAARAFAESLRAVERLNILPFQISRMALATAWRPQATLQNRTLAGYGRWKDEPYCG